LYYASSSLCNLLVPVSFLQLQPCRIISVLTSFTAVTINHTPSLFTQSKPTCSTNAYCTSFNRFLFLAYPLLFVFLVIRDRLSSLFISF